MKKIIILYILTLLVTGCGNSQTNNQNETAQITQEASPNGEAYQKVEEKPKGELINAEGNTILDRFKTPKGFEKTQTQEGSYADYLRNLKLKPYGTSIKLFNGREKGTNNHESIIDIDVGTRDLQQCADAAMRLWAEYLYKNEMYDKIHFNFTNGFKADYPTWMNGSRIVVKGNNVSWVKSAGYSKEYKSFREYMNMVFSYAGTLSLSKEMKKIPLEEMQIGDIFLKGENPGHCVVIVDMAENKKNHKKLFMIAQSYMPAQDIHILKNLEDLDFSPWYSSDFGEDLDTPEWIFYKAQLYRFTN